MAFKLINTKNRVSSVVSAIKEKEFTARHLKYIPLKGWLTLLYATLAPPIYFQLTNTGSDFLSIRYGLSYESSKNALTLVPFTAIFVLPFSSFIYGRFGLKAVGMLLCSCLGICSYSYFAFLPTKVEASNITAALIFMAFFYGINYGCMWTNLMLTIPKEASGLFLSLTITC